MSIEDRFKIDITNKLKELESQGYTFYQVNGRIAYHKNTNIPVGSSGYLDDLLKDWYLEKMNEYFGEILTKEVYIAFEM